MSTTDINKCAILSEFRSISLDDLSQRAAMLERMDRKYIVDRCVLDEVLRRMSGSFSALEINDVRTFGYRTLYFDSPERQSYLDHHQGRRRRAKVRMRHYVDARITYAEVKLKDRRGVTVKSRLELGASELDILPENAEVFVRDTYHSHYTREFPHALMPVVNIAYERMTLVSDFGGERLTIDSRLDFVEGSSAISVNPDLFIVETKSANGNVMADRILRSMHQHPVQHCSKYCLGTALLNKSLRSNRFKPVLRKLEKHV